MLTAKEAREQSAKNLQELHENIKKFAASLVNDSIRSAQDLEFDYEKALQQGRTAFTFLLNERFYNLKRKYLLLKVPQLTDEGEDLVRPYRELGYKITLVKECTIVWLRISW